jgi:hypothetical protein
MENHSLNLTTLTAPQHLAVEAARRLGLRSIPQRVPIQPTAGAERRLCYVNVREQVKVQGGEAVFGWGVTYFPRVLIECIHHSIWRAPGGNLIDVTPDKRGAPSRMFLQDVDVRNGERGMVTRYFSLTDNPIVLAYIEAQEHRSNLHVDSRKLSRPPIAQDLEERFAEAVLRAWHPEAPCVCGKLTALKKCCRSQVKDWLRANAT